MAESVFIRAEELAKKLDVSKATAYRMIREWNEQLKARGYTTVTGRVSRQYYREQVYGLAAGKELQNASV